MDTQAYVRTTPTSFIFSLPVYAVAPVTGASAKEIGYEIDDEELASEMLAELPLSLREQAAPQVDPEDFETIYKWFLA